MIQVYISREMILLFIIGNARHVYCVLCFFLLLLFRVLWLVRISEVNLCLCLEWAIVHLMMIIRFFRTYCNLQPVIGLFVHVMLLSEEDWTNIFISMKILFLVLVYILLKILYLFTDKCMLCNEKIFCSLALNECLIKHNTYANIPKRCNKSVLD